MSEKREEAGGAAEPEAPDFAERVLCVDEACIGLVGPDGRCKVCGKPGPAGVLVGAPAGTGGEETAAAREAAEGGTGEAAEGDTGETAEGGTGKTAEGGTGEDTGEGPDGPEGPGGIDLAHRRLCPDGACIGVIGPDGRCKVCGRLGV